MAHWSDDITWLLLTVTVSSNAVLGSFFASHGTWQDCSIEEPFLTLWNINLDDCVYECHVRTLCRSVNYNRVTKGCAMLTMDERVSPGPYPEMTQQQSCVFVQKKNISSLAWVIDACQNCDNASVCDAAYGNCTIKECRKLHVENAIIKGNMLVVGSNAIVECLDWYTLDRPNPQVVCQANGTWGEVPSCVPDAACGIPPDVTNAEAVTFNSVTRHAEYLCLDGYSTLGTANNAVLECRGDNTWADVKFTCITCGPPPAFINAEAVDVNSTANGIDYACLAAVAPSNQNDMTLVCGSNSMWEASGFTCIRYCDPDWVHIGSSCYYTPGPPTTRNHFDARDYCTAMDSYLLQLETQSESDAVKEYLNTTYGTADWWIGLTDLGHEGIWVWVVSGTASTFQDWIIEPDEGRMKNFAILQNTVGWEETTRHVLVVPVCEKM